MQGEAVHGISLPSCTAVIDIGAVTTRLQRSVSFVELRVGGLASVSSLHASGELVGKGKSDWGNEGRSFSFGSRSSRPAHSMVEIVGEACEFHFSGSSGLLIFRSFLPRWCCLCVSKRRWNWRVLCFVLALPSLDRYSSVEIYALRA